MAGARIPRRHESERRQPAGAADACRRATLLVIRLCSKNVHYGMPQQQAGRNAARLLLCPRGWRTRRVRSPVRACAHIAREAAKPPPQARVARSRSGRRQPIPLGMPQHKRGRFAAPLVLSVRWILRTQWVRDPARRQARITRDSRSATSGSVSGRCEAPEREQSRWRWWRGRAAAVASQSRYLCYKERGRQLPASLQSR